MNYKMLAIQIGDELKYDSTLRDINRAGESVFSFNCESFPNESITSSRAQLIHDWILTLAKQKINNEVRNSLLQKFLTLIVPSNHTANVEKILQQADIGIKIDNNLSDFMTRNLHEDIHRHCLKLFKQQNYFHAVFEAAKVYNKKVQEKAKSEKDGTSLMMEAWPTSGVLKVTQCKTQTDRNIQEGIKFLSAGLMQALRNPTSHEPALDWPIPKEDCLDMLSFISYLLRQLDKAVYYKQ